MSDGQLNVSIHDYLEGLASHDPPPGITSDPAPVVGVSPVDQWVKVLTAAANAGDPVDSAQSTEEHAVRDAKLSDAVAKFSAQDEEATQELTDVALQADPALAQATAPLTGTGAAATTAAADPASSMAQQLPQAASGIAGALAGALGGALQPLGQIPQQIAQGAQQAMQTGMGLFQQATGAAAAPLEDASLAMEPLGEDLGDLGAEDLGDLGGDLGAGGGDLAGLGGGGGELGAGDLGGGGLGGGLGGGGLPGGTAPVSMLGPAPIPTASTAPSSSPLTQITPPPATPATASAPGAMGGMPMVPPGALGGTGAGEKDAKADTRRVSVPPVRNGAPVQGRLTTPPTLPPVVKKDAGGPVVTRRVVVPRKLVDDDSDDDAKLDR